MFNKFKYIFFLIVTTPKFPIIISLNLFSILFIFAGLPLLIPALEYLKTNPSNEHFEKYTNYLNNFFIYFGIEINFYSLVITASLFIFIGQFTLLFIELFNKKIRLMMEKNFIQNLIEGYYHSNWNWISSDKSGRFQSAINREAAAASEAHQDSQRILTSLLQVFIYVFIVMFISIEITFSSLIFFLFLIIVNLFYSNKINYISKNANESFNNLSNKVSGLTQNKKLIKASQNYQSFFNLIFLQIDKLFGLKWKLNLLDGLLSGFTVIAGYFFIVTIFLIHNFIGLTFSELLILVLIFGRLAPQFYNLALNYARIAERMPIHQSIHSRILSMKNKKEITGETAYKKNSYILFDGVDFSYSKNKKILNEINLKIDAFKTTSLVGLSGAGKSTVLDLLLGLIHPTNGKIYYGNIHHNEIDIISFRKKVAYVSQDTTLFDGSVKFNLTIGNQGVSDEDIYKACKNSMIDEFINELPLKLETEIGENGIKLSGGQRQRIALCRALLSNPEILILDEATSQLDYETEMYIRKAINNLHNKLTIIIVAHRLSTVKNSDIIYVIDQGDIVEKGDYNFLINNKGIMSYLSEIQGK